MQRNHLLMGLAAGLFLALAWDAPPARAQDAATLEAMREEYESNHKQLLVRVEKMEETLQAQQKNVTRLAQEIHGLREEIDKLRSRDESSAIQKALKELQGKIEEVDRKRLADAEMVKKNLDAFVKELKGAVTPREIVPKPPKTPETTPPADPGKTPAPPEKGYAYKIKDGDTLVRIVTELRAQGYKTTQKQVMDANPGVNWTRLKIGQTVFIPPPNP